MAWRLLLFWKSGHALENGSNTLTAANAHGDQRVSALDALQFVQGFDGDQCASGANRVTQRDA
jgi:hypothetical protein